MLSKANRINRPDQFRQVMGRGVRFRSPVGQFFFIPALDGSTRWGFIVSRQVGKAVVRNRLKRRYRALSGQISLNLRGRWWIVVKAYPGAGKLEFYQLKASFMAAKTSLESDYLRR